MGRDPIPLYDWPSESIFLLWGLGLQPLVRWILFSQAHQAYGSSRCSMGLVSGILDPPSLVDAWSNKVDRAIVTASHGVNDVALSERLNQIHMVLAQNESDDLVSGES
ncbi:unnamed protein product [Dovyalis caffra]|uniref:Uncharacterized protein n=1 Tax=Dovyalis caffra TaxID=77055 RepID=A0AAV1RKL1_9ROSI|nr:unnamed protein product [Dovyalis caffra]